MVSSYRLSELADMLVNHIIYRRLDKARKIAQYLRAVTGMAVDPTLDIRTGYRRPKGQDNDI